MAGHSARVPAPGPRLIALKSEQLEIEAIHGLPDLLSTRAMCLVLAAFPLAVAIGLPAAFALGPPHPDLDPIAPALLLLCSALAICLVVIFVRAALRAGAFFSVTPTGFHFGDGDVVRGGTSIPWDHIASNETATHDVRVVWSTPHRGLPVARIAFWVRTSDDLVEGSIPMALIADRLRCLRFLNTDAVRTCWLRGMAARPTLRFDPEVFALAGLDPETFKTIGKPTSGRFATVTIVTAVVLGFGAIMIRPTPSVLIGAGILAALGFCLSAAVGSRAQRDPSQTRAIRFVSEPPASQAASTAIQL